MQADYAGLYIGPADPLGHICQVIGLCKSTKTEVGEWDNVGKKRNELPLAFGELTFSGIDVLFPSVV